MTTASQETKVEPRHISLRKETVLQDRYHIVRQLGRGGMGAVYEAIDQRLGITVALKETLSTDTDSRRQFEREARLLATMQHPALPRVSDHFVEGDRAFLVMQFIGGIDLAKIISKQPGPFPRDQVIAWADQLLDALIYLHSRDRQVVHRDIKPHNLKLTANGQIALLDFGLAKAQSAVDASVTASRAFFGYTKHYAPLEQIQDQRTDPRSDIYALGATLYHLLTGTKPPDALVRATALINSEQDPLRSANELHAAVGSEISGILNKAMSLKSEDRYASAGEFREALRRLGRTMPVRTEAPVVEPVKSKPAELKIAMVVSRRRFGPGAVTTLVVLVVAAASTFLYKSPAWFAAAAKPANETIERVQQPAQRKVERPRVTNTLTVTPAKPKSGESESRRTTEEKNGRSNSNVDVQPRKTTPTPRRGVKAPRVRLPDPEIAANATAMASPSPRNYGMNPSPKFYRNADGSFIVKFADGTTRIVKPGQRTAE